jgi:hypothetical protein
MAEVVIAVKGTTLRSWWPVRPKIVFDQMAVPVSEIMETTSYGDSHPDGLQLI